MENERLLSFYFPWTNVTGIKTAWSRAIFGSTDIFMVLILPLHKPWVSFHLTCLLQFPPPESCSSQNMHAHFLSLCCVPLLCVLCCMDITLHTIKNNKSLCDHLSYLTLPFYGHVYSQEYLISFILPQCQNKAEKSQKMSHCETSVSPSRLSRPMV